jgi:uncharacterized lipoprotein YddW (UPF0748 family)
VAVAPAVRESQTPPPALPEQAEAAYAAKNYPEALRLYEAVVKEMPGNAHARARILELKSTVQYAPAPVSADVASMSAPNPDPGKSGGTAKPTAKDGKGGATPQTENMPLDLPSLVEMRKQFLGKPEFRGAWVTRMDWASPNAGQIRSRITRIMDNAKSAGLNAVLFQVRGDATTLYPSPLEPWSQRVGGEGPGLDPVKFAIEEAHKRGLEFHAYFNPGPCSEEKIGPTDPRHIWFQHCTAESNPNWLVYEGGKPAAFNEYWWLNLNLPEVQTYIRAAVVDLVARYDVDGVHFDRIRFPSSKVSDDPWSKARFDGIANPLKLSYAEWQRDNITRMLTDIYGATAAIKPAVKFTAAVWGIYDKTKLPRGADKKSGYSWTSSGLQDYNQDSIAWTRKGCMDALIPMVYWNMGENKPDYDELVADFVKQVGNGRHVYGGQQVFDDVEMIREVVATSLVGGMGTCPFTLNKLVEKGLAGFYRANIFPDTVPTPEMPWKTRPGKGIVLVTVKDAQGMPVMDAHVKIPTRSDVWLSSADGFCAIIDAPLAEGLVLTVEKPGVAAMVSSQPVDVAPGKPASVTVSLK